MPEVADSLLKRLPPGVKSRLVDGVNGLKMHVLEAGENSPEKPCLLLLHGFPELAFSWRRVMPLLAAEGYYVVAPDQRGYGRTTGWSADYDGDLAPFSLLNLVRDVVALLASLGRTSVAAVIGHDFGSPVAAWCALTRPDIFRSVVLMSAPFAGPPAPQRPDPADMDRQLAALSPSRKHYQRYYGTRDADTDMMTSPDGLAGFLRAYFHCKSGDWAGNAPFRLQAWKPEELATMPDYYIMRLDDDMPRAVASMRPSQQEIAACAWLPDDDLNVYVEEYSRTGFQGGLQWYRCNFDDRQLDELSLYHGKPIDIPACFIAGDRDWGVYQFPGAFEAMQSTACSAMNHVHLVPGAGHWVQQENPQTVTRHLLRFLRG